MSTQIPSCPAILYFQQEQKGRISLSSELVGDKTLFKVRIYGQKVTATTVTLKLSLEWAQTYDGQVLNLEQRKALPQDQWCFVGAKENLTWNHADLSAEQLTAVKFYDSRESSMRAAFKANSANKDKNFVPKKRWAIVAPGKALGLKINFAELNQPKQAIGAKSAPNPYFLITDLDISALVFQGIEEPAVACPKQVTGSLDEANELCAQLIGAQVATPAPQQAPTTPPSGSVSATLFGAPA